ncbi:12764_t:CDS:1, partial [Gigaspora rosea]
LNVSTPNNTIIVGQQTNFTVFASFGLIQSDIEASDELLILFCDDDNKNAQSFNTCVCGESGLPLCPIKAGTPFTASISVVVPLFPFPDIFDVFIEIVKPDIFDVYAEIVNPLDHILACAHANGWTDSPKFK